MNPPTLKEQREAITTLRSLGQRYISGRDIERQVAAIRRREEQDSHKSLFRRAWYLLKQAFTDGIG